MNKTDCFKLIINNTMPKIEQYLNKKNDWKMNEQLEKKNNTLLWFYNNRY